MSTGSSSRRHIPYLSFHKQIIREICRPQKDDLLILAKGLGMRRIICALLKTYDRKEDLVLVVNASPSDEAGIGDELGIMGVRDPGFRVLNFEMSVAQREEMYRGGGLFSVTSKILVNDFLKGTVPIKLVTGLVILHAEKVSHGSQEEFAVRLYRRENQSGFCKAFSDEPEMFAHGMSPLKDMLVNLNMNNVMVWPRYNEAVKMALATRQAEVVEMYQPMTDAMRQCQDAITECMEAMLVELKRDHSLNLDLEDINVRNAQFKNFDTIVRMRLKPVWHKVGAKTKIHVAALTELRNLHTWLLEYDSATFASYINTLQRQHFQAERIPGLGRHVHDWFNAKASALLVEASQSRVSKKSLVMTMDNEPGPELRRREAGTDYEDDESAMRDIESLPNDDDEFDIMDTIATQTQTVPQSQSVRDDGMEEGGEDEDDDEGLREVSEDAPPVFRPLSFGLEDNLEMSVKRRIRKGHEVVLEEQPKWALLAKVLKEVEDTITRVSETHADQPGTNIVLVMAASDRTCLQLRQYLTTMQKTSPPFGPHAGRKMMETLFLSNWQHEKNGERLANPARMGGDQVNSKGDIEKKKNDEQIRKRNASSYKRRRTRAGAVSVGTRGIPDDMSHKEAMFKAHSAFGGGPTVLPRTNNGGGGAEGDEDDDDLIEIQPLPPVQPPNRPPGSGPIAKGEDLPDGEALTDAGTTLLAKAGVIEEEDLDSDTRRWMIDAGLMPEDFDHDYGLLAPDDAVIIRPYGGEDDDILLQELRPRFVILYEPNLAFIRRLEVYKNCNPGLALRVYQMTYTNSFEEDRYLSTMSREAEAFKKLIEDRQSMVIPIYNNNPRAPMRDNVSRSKTTYSTRNAGGDGTAEESRIIVDIREMGAILPSLIDYNGIKVIPATLTVGDYILTPKICVERKALPDLESSFNSGRLHSQCEAMTAHYETCILLIEFEEDKFGLRTQADARRESAGRNADPNRDRDDAFELQSKLVLLSLHFPSLRIIWSSSSHESIKILADLKLNHDEPDEISAILKGSSGAGTDGNGDSLRPSIENDLAVAMLRAIPGVSGHQIKYIMAKVESIREFVELSKAELVGLLGEKGAEKAYRFIHADSRRMTRRI